MSQAKILQEKAEMFERRAESATDPSQAALQGDGGALPVAGGRAS
jgi:hypothetical protein